MEHGENFKREGLPALQQVYYLMELERLGRNGKKRGSVTRIAKTCGVHRSSVNRYFKKCLEEGYLTEGLDLTEKGKKWLGEYRQLIRRLRVYFQEMGMDEAETEGNVRVMIEHMEPKTILCMIQKQTEQGSLREQEAKQMVGGMIHYGTYPVDFALYRQDGKKQGERSVADRGFQKPALLRHNRRGSYLQLEICETQGKSRVSGITMRGHLESLKYRDRGILCQADIRAGRLKIPLRVFAFRKKQDGTLKGILPVTVSASVGRTHMPESTALLIFWF